MILSQRPPPYPYTYLLFDLGRKLPVPVPVAYFRVSFPRKSFPKSDLFSSSCFCFQGNFLPLPSGSCGSLFQ